VTAAVVVVMMVVVAALMHVCQFPISDCQVSKQACALIGNWQSTIGN
jgi:hypothetical protein